MKVSIRRTFSKRTGDAVEMLRQDHALDFDTIFTTCRSGPTYCYTKGRVGSGRVKVLTALVKRGGREPLSGRCPVRC